MKRRDFLKTSLAAGGAVLAGYPLVNANAEAEHAQMPGTSSEMPVAHAAAQTTSTSQSSMASSATPRKVFAHYVVSNKSYGGSVAGYERDIREAMALGIDGFALNVGVWNDSGTQTTYQADTASFFRAAKNVSPNGDFKLFFSFDLIGGLSSPGITPAQLVAAFSMYSVLSTYPNYWYATSAAGDTARPVMSTYGGDGSSQAEYQNYWDTGVFQPLMQMQIYPFFIPGFSIPALGLTYKTRDMKGVFASDIGANTENHDEAYVSPAANANLLLMSSVSPHYWQNRAGTGRYYLESYGYEVLIAQWTSILNVQKPAFVEIFTWNDFAEGTYLSPIDDVARYWPYPLPSADNTRGYMTSHGGFAKLCAYYIQWYKTGSQPIITNDTLFWAYRTHPATATASADTLPPPSSYGDANGPITAPPDNIFVAVLATADNTLVTKVSGNSLEPYTAPVGVSTTRFSSYQQGLQTFSLSRTDANNNVVELCSGVGRNIDTTPALYNFGYETGFAEAPAIVRVLAINAGGSAIPPFAADLPNVGGNTNSFNASVDLRYAINPAPEYVYRTERYGNFSYVLTGMTASLSYLVRLHFSENYDSGASQRVFNVSINGAPVLSNYDIFVAAGAVNRAKIESFMIAADGSGSITVAFTTGTSDVPKVDALEVWSLHYE